jgi:hypothetical protein
LPFSSLGNFLIDIEIEGALTIPARTGSRVQRTDGGAGTSFYVNEANGNNWIAK